MSRSLIGELLFTFHDSRSRLMGTEGVMTPIYSPLSLTVKDLAGLDAHLAEAARFLFEYGRFHDTRKFPVILLHNPQAILFSNLEYSPNEFHNQRWLQSFMLGFHVLARRHLFYS